MASPAASGPRWRHLIGPVLVSLLAIGLVVFVGANGVSALMEHWDVVLAGIAITLIAFFEIWVLITKKKWSEEVHAYGILVAVIAVLLTLVRLDRFGPVEQHELDHVLGHAISEYGNDDDYRFVRQLITGRFRKLQDDLYTHPKRWNKMLRDEAVVQVTAAANMLTGNDRLYAIDHGVPLSMWRTPSGGPSAYEMANRAHAKRICRIFILSHAHDADVDGVMQEQAHAGIGVRLIFNETIEGLGKNPYDTENAGGAFFLFGNEKKVVLFREDTQTRGDQTISWDAPADADSWQKNFNWLAEHADQKLSEGTDCWKPPSGRDF
jgi:hypothetical protein